jgi:hypothetical protein
MGLQVWLLAVEHLLCKHKSVSSNPSPIPPKKKIDYIKILQINTENYLINGIRERYFKMYSKIHYKCINKGWE